MAQGGKTTGGDSAPAATSAADSWAGLLAVVDAPQLLQDIADASGVLIFAKDLEGRYLLVNRRACEAVGMAQEQMLGHRDEDLFDADRANSYREHDRQVLREGTTVQFEEEAVHSGHRLSLLCVKFPLRDQKGRIYGVCGICTDITQRKRAEDELRSLAATLEQRVAERTALAERQAAQLRRLTVELTQAEQRERRRIAHTLHDHLQQILVAVKMRLSSGSRHDVGPMLDEAINASRSLAAQLSPPVLNDRGLVAALRWLARQMEQDQGLKIILEVRDEAQELDFDLRHFVFQAVRELLLNVVRHSGQKRATLAVRRDPGNLLSVEVADAGNGCDVNQMLHAAAHEGAFGLFSIQQRLAHLGGDLKVFSEPGHGCRVIMQVPMA